MKTILYYTGNFKDPVFSQKIRDNILTNSNLPIVSVSQEPINFGENICVGKVGRSYLNVYRQILIGATDIKTEYIIFCEDDFLYPPSYFKFDLIENENFLRYGNTWMVLHKGPYYRTKPIGGAQIMKRDLCVDVLEEYLHGCPMFYNGNYKIDKTDYMGAHFDIFTGDQPVIAFKPNGNLSKSGSSIGSIKELPVWGNVKDLRKKYL
jgi:hypothetical protein